MTKRFLIVPILAAAFVLSAQYTALAVPAAPGIRELKQPDGTVIRARLRGDESRHWWETEAGAVIAKDARTGFWKAAVKPSAAGPLRAKRIDKAVPSIGTGYLPVLCVNFSDTTTTYEPADFQEALFSGPNSMTNYYEEVSHSRFTVNAGPGGIGGWYDASQNHDYYGANDTDGSDLHAAELVIEAVQAADAAGFNFGPYDTDGDGYVDVLAIVHQGTDESAGGPATDIWSHSWTLEYAQMYGDGTGPYTTDDGVIVNSYIIQPETTYGGQVTTSGVYCHEYGHALGLPDLYDTTYRSNGVGLWSIMAAGSWGGPGNDGSVPTHMDAWCKMKLGWLTPTVARHQTGVSIPQAETNAVAYKIEATGSGGDEYFLVENRQRVNFDAYLPGAGLLIYHVDDAMFENGDNDNVWYPGLPGTNHYLVAVEQADGDWALERYFSRGDAGDPYPGTSNNRRFDLTSTPSATRYDDSPSPLVVRNISPSGTTMTADFVDPSPPTAPRTIAAIDTPDDEGLSTTVTWSRSADDGRGANDVVGYQVWRSSAGEGGPFTSVSGLLAPRTTVYVDTGVDPYNPATTPTQYWYKVSVHDANGSAETRVVGPVSALDDLAPVAIAQLTARDTGGDTGGSITLSWSGYETPSDFAEYRVYRATNSFTSINQTGVTRIDNAVAPAGTLTNPTTQGYIDTAVEDGTLYWYAVTAVDNTQPTGNEEPNVTAVGPVVSSPNFTFSYATGYNLMAIGAQTQEKDMATLLGIPKEDLQLARWDPTAASYVTYRQSPASSFLQQGLGRAFWFRAPRAVIVDIAGQAAADDSVSVSFLPGWNMIGNPYTSDMTTVGTTVNASGRTGIGLAEASALGWVRDYMWAYDTVRSSYKLVSPTIDFADEIIRKGAGVFFRAFVAGDLTLPRPGAAATATSTPQAPAITADWKLRIVAESGAGCDVDNFVGASSDSATLNAIVSPPARGVDFYFVDGSGAHAAARFSAAGAGAATYAAKVAVTEAGPVTLRWPDLTELPADVRPVLVDVATGKRLYMRTTASYTFDARPDAEREFEVVLRTDAAGALVVQTVAATPTAGGAQVAFTLNQDAAVTVEVLNVAGRHIRSLVTGAAVSAAQVKTLTWDGTGALGTKVPAGRYLVRIVAQTEDGQQASAMGAVSLRR